MCKTVSNDIVQNMSVHYFDKHNVVRKEDEVILSLEKKIKTSESNQNQSKCDSFLGGPSKATRVGNNCAPYMKSLAQASNNQIGMKNARY